MSRKNQPKEKRLDNLEVVTSDQVWDKVGTKETGQIEFKLKPGIKLFGKVKKGTSAYVSTTNRKGENHKFVDDFSSLNIKTKKEICDLIENQNKRVVYLVEKSSLPPNTTAPKLAKKSASSSASQTTKPKKGGKKK